MMLAEEAMVPNVELRSLQLASKRGLEGLGWAAVDRVKRILAHVNAQERREARWLASAIEKSSVQARGSSRFSNLLTASYRRILEEQSGRIVSSHYLALINRPLRFSATLLGPDLLVQPAVEGIAAPRRAISPCRLYSDGLVRAGFRIDEIIERGPLLPRRVIEARSQRLRVRERLADGDGVPEVLVTVGGSAPERLSVLQVAEDFKKTSLRIHVLVGDDRPHAVELRTRLKKARADIEVYGGTRETRRVDELKLFLDLLSQPELTVWLSRPNEGCMLALALGFELWLLPPYQLHEKAAAHKLVGQGIRWVHEMKPGELGRDPRDKASEWFVEPIDVCGWSSDERESLNWSQVGS